MRIHLEKAMRGGQTKGFTLLELMIVVIVVAILAALAFFNYSKYVFRAHRVDGKNLLMNIAAAEERYYTNFNKYTGTITAAAPAGLGFTNADSEQHGSAQTTYYTATAALSSVDQAYTLTATPHGPQAADKCVNLTLDNTGLKAFVPVLSNVRFKHLSVACDPCGVAVKV